MNFTQTLHVAAQSLWQKSMCHPFVIELQRGQLPLSKFRFYLLQDRYYLTEFSRQHQVLAAQTSNSQIAGLLLAGAQSLQESEINVREQFFTQLKIMPAEIAHTPMAPTTYAYLNHLQMTLNQGGFAPAVAALVPCYWLYQELGQKLAVNGSPVALYQEWIATYDANEYEQNVARFLQLTNLLAEQATIEEQKLMQQAFLRSSYYELQFWQMAYEEEQWQ